MIKLKNIKKIYQIEERKLNALKGISLDMRKSEFVCVLGPSGCGKTTLLNIIGGLDRYSSGDLIIDGKSTKRFTDEDWDTYRSRKVGFVFQSYNLISHQTVLENVETALVISGIGREERRKMAIDALVKVGLAEHLRKTPRQLSGGEMQRVAIARAIVNNPQMILADEPTGALDSENSVKIMDLLKEIAKDRLVITVTHNNELAESYATRIIRMKDGEILEDSAPYKSAVEEEKKEEKRKSFMPYSLATKLSLKNLAGKKVRTALTSIASSIAIVGIALVLACTNGLNYFIDKIQMDTMSSIPITVSSKSTNYAPMIEGIFGYVSSTAKGENKQAPTNSVIINHALKNMQATEITNEISAHFTNYLENGIGNKKGLDKNRVRYDAVKNVTKNVYKKVNVEVYPISKVSCPLNIIEQNAGSWSCLPPDRYILDEQYHLVAGKYPESATELLLVVDKNSAIADTVLAKHLIDVYAVDENLGKGYYTYDEILTNPIINEYNLVLNDDFYGTENFSTAKKVDLTSHIETFYRGEVKALEDILKSNEYIKEIYNSIRCYNVDPNKDDGSIKLKIVGIVKLNDDTQYGMLTSPIAYTSALNDFVIEKSYNSAIVTAQLEKDGVNVLTGATVSGKTALNNTLSSFGYAELPTQIKFYPRTIKDKDYLLEFLDAYNEINGDNPDITYTDNVGAVIELVRVVVGGVSAILIALTAISLVVSAIMIGIITYVSVIERTKEIGILRSVGARKKDVVRLFVTETGMIGFIAGICGLILTLLVCIPLNVIMANLTGVTGFVFLYWWNFIALIVGSSLLTVVAGLIPSLLASKQDPVKALRSE
ncbi:MAG: ATP-binding cassette domain-containing protein [Clostridiales bacterium]|nr:ATP-binding cassette domain-containing protein [Clostridiales bacterium]